MPVSASASAEGVILIANVEFRTTALGRSLPLDHAPRTAGIGCTGAIGQAASRGGPSTGQETDSLVDSAGRGLVRELGHGRYDPAPSRRPVIVAGKR